MTNDRQVSVRTNLGERAEIALKPIGPNSDLRVSPIRFEVLCVRGMPEFQDWVTRWVDCSNRLGRAAKVDDLKALFMDPVPTSAVLYLLAELRLRSEGAFADLETGREICHCRSVSAERVDQAILLGASSPSAVARATGAGTSCGTCQPETQDLIERRLLTLK